MTNTIMRLRRWDFSSVLIDCTLYEPWKSSLPLADTSRSFFIKSVLFEKYLPCERYTYHYWQEWQHWWRRQPFSPNHFITPEEACFTSTLFQWLCEHARSIARWDLWWQCEQEIIILHLWPWSVTDHHILKSLVLVELPSLLDDVSLLIPLFDQSQINVSPVTFASPLGFESFCTEDPFKYCAKGLSYRQDAPISLRAKIPQISKD